jgi:prolyl-tRNA synthetase
MRTSTLLLGTLKETPADAEIISHQMMLRAGMIRKLASGLYTWLPLGLRVLRKVEKIVREEMDNAGAQELLMPVVQPEELWQETDRWEKFGPQLLKIKDRHHREFCFGPTHEEVITDLIRRELKSYKQLPINLYQIQIKFRDEIRPRFGVMRAREFIMKDAYSFHIDSASLQETYDKMYAAYSQIFTRLGLTFRAVLADTGSIGGSVSHEFHVLAESGEDLIAYSTESQYAANLELAKSLLSDAKSTSSSADASTSISFVKTPDIKSVEGQAQHLGVETKQILKTLLVKGRSKEHPIVALLVRGDHELNPVKAEKCPLVAVPFAMASVKEVEALAHCGPGFVGPKELNIPLYADPAVLLMKNFICGANQEDTHYAGFNWGKDCETPLEWDLRFVQEGDISPDGQGTLKFARGIEVGHIFQLGDKYSQAMKAVVLDESGRARVMVMGCYGIGVSRIVAAAIEQNHDERGIRWPKSMAPFQIVLIPINMKRSEIVKDAANALYQNLLAKGVEVLFDDREERPGVMFADAELIGIPHRVVISEKGLALGQYEYKARESDTTQNLSLEDVFNLF